MEKRFRFALWLNNEDFSLAFEMTPLFDCEREDGWRYRHPSSQTLISLKSHSEH
jgi:hypothetical protein